MKKYKLSVWALALIIALPFGAQAQTKKKTTLHTSATNLYLPLDPNVRMGKLSNGFTYYIRHNEEPKKRSLCI